MHDYEGFDGFKQNMGKWILFGVMFLILSLSKSIAIVCVASVIGFFILQKQLKFAGYAAFSFGIFKIIYEIIIRLIIGQSDSGQFEQILLKDIYKPELGKE